MDNSKLEFINKAIQLAIGSSLTVSSLLHISMA